MYLELYPHIRIFHVVFPRDQHSDPIFSICANDMSDTVNNKLLLYTDDSAISVADKYVSNILQNEFEIVSEWLVDNKLSLHLGKMESILFGSSPRLKSQSVLSITYKGTAIEAKYTVKYLGVVLEQCLSGVNMATSIIQKANTRLKFLYRKQKFFNLKTKKLL